MAIEVNTIYKTENGDNYSDEPFLVTIALEEYRSLIQENTRLQERVEYLENRLADIVGGNIR